MIAPCATTCLHCLSFSLFLWLSVCLFPQNCLNGILGLEHPRRVGLNNGVMLLDVDKMTQVGFIEECLDIGGNETLRFQLADQDIMNVYFNRHPERLLWLPYWWARVANEHTYVYAYVHHNNLFLSVCLFSGGTTDPTCSMRTWFLS